MSIWEWLKAFLYGMTEGITEWLPVSSTGHLILLRDRLPFRFSDDPVFLSEFFEMFEVVIQLGAICAVIVLFRRRLCPVGCGKTPRERRETFTLWGKVVVSGIPCALVGVFGDKLLERFTGRDINGWLYRASVVATALIVYGIAFLIVEKRRRQPDLDLIPSETVSYRTAFLIGCFQVLSLVPGTSRSGSTVLGGMLLGLSRTAAAEFSFFMAIPVMFGASGIKMLGFFSYLSGSGTTVPRGTWGLLLLGCAVSFAVSLVTIRFLLDFVRRHGFSAFGVYRIVLGTAVLLYFGVQTYG